MKRFIIISLILLGSTFAEAQNKDLPGVTYNLQTIAAGSYIIPMDNTYQRNSVGFFNMKAYGMLVYLLNNGVRVKWAIRGYKNKDEDDFTALSEQIKPTAVLGGVSTNFKGGPFIIEAVDTTGVAALVDAYYALKALTGTNRPTVRRLTANANFVDIRYDLTGYIVRSAILTDGGNEDIHEDYMIAAGIPNPNYRFSNGTDLVGSCFTFASEPHNGNSGAAVNAAITGIKNFVTAGGNFLAQCEGVVNYENNGLGRFQTTGGIDVVNATVGTAVTVPNADLSFSQFEGGFNANYGGSVKNWKIMGSGINNQHNHITGTGANASVLGASVAKIGTGLGGLVFYLGSHEFKATTVEGTNGLRMYMNAMMTPARYNCPVSVLPLQFTRFTANATTTHTDLSWTVSSNEQVERFEIERSFDGRSFNPAAGIPANFRINEESYSYKDQPFATTTYYRIKMTDREGKTTYSTIACLNMQSETNNPLRIIYNPVTSGDLLFTYQAALAGQVQVQLINTAGQVLYLGKEYCTKGVTQFFIPQQALQAKGSYILQVTTADLQKATARVIKM